MTTPPTAAEALAMARASIEDDKRATPPPWTWDTEDPPDGLYDSHGERIITTDSGVYGPNADDRAFIAASRTREPALARFVEAVLGVSPPGIRARVLRDGFIEHPGLSGPVSPAIARVIAAEMLRAADESEAARTGAADDAERDG